MVAVVEAHYIEMTWRYHNWLPRSFGQPNMGIEFNTYKDRARYISYVLVNYNDLTATSLESWFVGEIIPKWALIQVSEILQLTQICVQCRWDPCKATL